ncbi:hypothetical protein M8J77_026247 [Diaphorina citri]|nr:hypothetical protein M8J77_026247 [Diaphorina citri]
MLDRERPQVKETGRRPQYVTVRYRRPESKRTKNSHQAEPQEYERNLGKYFMYGNYFEPAPPPEDTNILSTLMKCFKTKLRQIVQDDQTFGLGNAFHIDAKEALDRDHMSTCSKTWNTCSKTVSTSNISDVTTCFDCDCKFDPFSSLTEQDEEVQPRLTTSNTSCELVTYQTIQTPTSSSSVLIILEETESESCPRTSRPGTMRAQHCQCEGRTELGMWKVETHKPATTNSRRVYTTRNTPTPSSIPPSREQKTSRFHTELNSKLSSYFEEYTVQPQHLSLPTTPCYEVYRSTTKPTESFPPTPNSQSDDQLCREPWEQNKSDRQSSRRRSPEKSERQSTGRRSSEKSDRQSTRRQSTEKSDRQSTRRWSPEKQSEFGRSRTPTRYARESSEHIGEPRTWPSDSEESESSTIVIELGESDFYTDTTTSSTGSSNLSPGESVENLCDECKCCAHYCTGQALYTGPNSLCVCYSTQEYKETRFGYETPELLGRRTRQPAPRPELPAARKVFLEHKNLPAKRETRAVMREKENRGQRNGDKCGAQQEKTDKCRAHQEKTEEMVFQYKGKVPGKEPAIQNHHKERPHKLARKQTEEYVKFQYKGSAVKTRVRPDEPEHGRRRGNSKPCSDSVKVAQRTEQPGQVQMKLKPWTEQSWKVTYKENRLDGKDTESSVVFKESTDTSTSGRSVRTSRIRKRSTRNSLTATCIGDIWEPLSSSEVVTRQIKKALKKTPQLFATKVGGAEKKKAQSCVSIFRPLLDITSISRPFTSNSRKRRPKNIFSSCSNRRTTEMNESIVQTNRVGSAISGKSFRIVFGNQKVARNDCSSIEHHGADYEIDSTSSRDLKAHLKAQSLCKCTSHSNLSLEKLNFSKPWTSPDTGDYVDRKRKQSNVKIDSKLTFYFESKTENNFVKCARNFLSVENDRNGATDSHSEVVEGERSNPREVTVRRSASKDGMNIDRSPNAGDLTVRRNAAMDFDGKSKRYENELKDNATERQVNENTALVTNPARHDILLSEDMVATTVTVYKGENIRDHLEKLYEGARQVKSLEKLYEIQETKLAQRQRAVEETIKKGKISVLQNITTLKKCYKPILTLPLPTTSDATDAIETREGKGRNIAGTNDARDEVVNTIVYDEANGRKATKRSDKSRHGEKRIMNNGVMQSVRNARKKIKKKIRNLRNSKEKDSRASNRGGSPSSEHSGRRHKNLVFKDFSNPILCPDLNLQNTTYSSEIHVRQILPRIKLKTAIKHNVHKKIKIKKVKLKRFSLKKAQLMNHNRMVATVTPFRLNAMLCRLFFVKQILTRAMHDREKSTMRIGLNRSVINVHIMQPILYIKVDNHFEYLTLLEKCYVELKRRVPILISCKQAQHPITCNRINLSITPIQVKRIDTETVLFKSISFMQNMVRDVFDFKKSDDINLQPLDELKDNALSEDSTNELFPQPSNDTEVETFIESHELSNNSLNLRDITDDTKSDMNTVAEQRKISSAEFTLPQIKLPETSNVSIQQKTLDTRERTDDSFPLENNDYLNAKEIVTDISKTKAKNVVSKSREVTKDETSILKMRKDILKTDTIDNERLSRVIQLDRVTAKGIIEETTNTDVKMPKKYDAATSTPEINDVNQSEDLTDIIIKSQHNAIAKLEINNAVDLEELDDEIESKDGNKPFEIVKKFTTKEGAANVVITLGDTSHETVRPRENKTNLRINDVIGSEAILQEIRYSDNFITYSFVKPEITRIIVEKIFKLSEKKSSDADIVKGKMREDRVNEDVHEQMETAEREATKETEATEMKMNTEPGTKSKTRTYTNESTTTSDIRQDYYTSKATSTSTTLIKNSTIENSKELAFRRSQIAPSAKDIGSTNNIFSSEMKSLTVDENLDVKHVTRQLKSIPKMTKDKSEFYETIHLKVKTKEIDFDAVEAEPGIPGRSFTDSENGEEISGAILRTRKSPVILMKAISKDLLHKKSSSLGIISMRELDQLLSKSEDLNDDMECNDHRIGRSDESSTLNEIASIDKTTVNEHKLERSDKTVRTIYEIASMDETIVNRAAAKEFSISTQTNESIETLKMEVNESTVRIDKESLDIKDDNKDNQMKHVHGLVDRETQPSVITNEPSLTEIPSHNLENKSTSCTNSELQSNGPSDILHDILQSLDQDQLRFAVESYTNAFTKERKFEAFDDTGERPMDASMTEPKFEAFDIGVEDSESSNSTVVIDQETFNVMDSAKTIANISESTINDEDNLVENMGEIKRSDEEVSEVMSSSTSTGTTSSSSQDTSNENSDDNSLKEEDDLEMLDTYMFDSEVRKVFSDAYEHTLETLSERTELSTSFTSSGIFVNQLMSKLAVLRKTLSSDLPSYTNCFQTAFSYMESLTKTSTRCIEKAKVLKQGFNFHADQIQLEVQNKIFIQTRDQCYVLKPFLVKKNSSANKRKRYDLMKRLKRDMSQESERRSSATIRNVSQNALKPSSQHAPQNEPKTNYDKTRISPDQSNFKWIKNSTIQLEVSLSSFKKIKTSNERLPKRSQVPTSPRSKPFKLTAIEANELTTEGMPKAYVQQKDRKDEPPVEILLESPMASKLNQKSKIPHFARYKRKLVRRTNSLAVSPKPTGEHTGGNPTETVPDGKTTQVDAVNETLPDAQKQKNLSRYTKSKYSKRRKLRSNSKLPVRNLSLSETETLNIHPSLAIIGKAPKGKSPSKKLKSKSSKKSSGASDHSSVPGVPELQNASKSSNANSKNRKATKSKVSLNAGRGSSHNISLKDGNKVLLRDDTSIEAGDNDLQHNNLELADSNDLSRGEVKPSNAKLSSKEDIQPLPKAHSLISVHNLSLSNRNSFSWENGIKLSFNDKLNLSDGNRSASNANLSLHVGQKLSFHDGECELFRDGNNLTLSNGLKRSSKNPAPQHGKDLKLSGSIKQSFKDVNYLAKQDDNKLSKNKRKQFSNKNPAQQNDSNLSLGDIEQFFKEVNYLAEQDSKEQFGSKSNKLPQKDGESNTVNNTLQNDRANLSQQAVKSPSQKDRNDLAQQASNQSQKVGNKSSRKSNGRALSQHSAENPSQNNCNNLSQQARNQSQNGGNKPSRHAGKNPFKNDLSDKSQCADNKPSRNASKNSSLNKVHKLSQHTSSILSLSYKTGMSFINDSNLSVTKSHTFSVCGSTTLGPEENLSPDIPDDRTKSAEAKTVYPRDKTLSTDGSFLSLDGNSLFPDDKTKSAEDKIVFPEGKTSVEDNPLATADKTHKNPLSSDDITPYPENKTPSPDHNPLALDDKTKFADGNGIRVSDSVRLFFHFPPSEINLLPSAESQNSLKAIASNKSTLGRDETTLQTSTLDISKTNLMDNITLGTSKTTLRMDKITLDTSKMTLDTSKILNTKKTTLGMDKMTFHKSKMTLGKIKTTKQYPTLKDIRTSKCRSKAILGSNNTTLGRSKDKKTTGIDKMALKTSKMTFGTSEILDASKNTLGTRKILDTSIKTLDTSKTILGTSKITLGTSKATLGTSKTLMEAFKPSLATKKASLGISKSTWGKSGTTLGKSKMTLNRKWSRTPYTSKTSCVKSISSHSERDRQFALRRSVILHKIGHKRSSRASKGRSK